MAKKGVARYSASESMLGYMYQSRHALFAFLQRNRVAPTVRVSIEKFDDVAFEVGGQADELIQTKHRAVPGNLTDASEDLWKMLRVWSEGVRDKEFPLPGTVFTLLTTETAPDGSAAAMLRPGAGRDHIKAEGVLKARPRGVKASGNREGGEFPLAAARPRIARTGPWRTDPSGAGHSGSLFGREYGQVPPCSTNRFQFATLAILTGFGTVDMLMNGDRLAFRQE